MTKVSVVVPVFEPGPRFDRCIRSILEQSLPPGELEAVFVDDGSADGTAERLERLAAEHPHVRLERIPNSGWPSRPRNLGTDLAGGEYVLYADNDDWLDRRAAERLYARAAADDADVVVGKVVGHGKNVPRELFARNRSDVTLDWPPLLQLMSPHKLFRRAFLADHAIRFPEERRYLEDHHFVAHAFLHAERISVLAEHPCYHWKLHGGASASFQRMDPPAYFASLRAVLDLVEEHTRPGPRRDRLLAHWYRSKVLWRAGGLNLLQRRPEVRPALHEELRRIVAERFDARLDALLAFNLRVRARVLREGTLEDLERLAAWEGRLQPALACTAHADGAGLDVHVEAALAAGGEPLAFAPERGRMLWVPPTSVAAALPPGLDRDATLDLARSRVELFARHARRRIEHLVPVDCTPAGSAVNARGRLDPESAAAGRRLPPGRWKLGTTVQIAGFRSEAFPLAAGGDEIVLEVARRQVRRGRLQGLGRRLSGR